MARARTVRKLTPRAKVRLLGIVVFLCSPVLVADYLKTATLPTIRSVPIKHVPRATGPALCDPGHPVGRILRATPLGQSI